jgi:hypothetical protein
MTDKELEQWMEAGARLLDLPLKPEWRDSVRLHLAATLQLAERVMAFELPDEIDPAAIFRA